MKPGLPRISIVIPTLNEEKYIETTLKSLKNQNYLGKYEIIVADGKSTDKTVSIARKYDTTIVIVEKPGASAGRNAGARVATGKILIFLDADTILIPNALKEVDKAFKNGIALVGIFTLPLDYSFGSLVAHWVINSVSVKSAKYGKALMPGFFMSCRRDVFDKEGGFNETLKAGEDMDLSLRLSKRGKARVLDTTIAFTSVRRLKKWGQLYFMYRYLGGYLVGKIFKKGGWETVR